MHRKKVLVISSSPRKGGNSDTLCNQFMKGAIESGHDVEKIFLGDKKINYCTGCDICSIKNIPCPQNDDANEIINKMIDSDVIVFGTPVYFYTMSAQLKTLIDRCCGPYEKISNKEFYLMLAAADSEKTNLDQTVDSLRGFFCCLSNAKLKGVVYGTGVWHVGEIQENQAMSEAYKVGKQI